MSYQDKPLGGSGPAIGCSLQHAPGAEKVPRYPLNSVTIVPSMAADCYRKLRQSR